MRKKFKTETELASSLAEIFREGIKYCRPLSEIVNDADGIRYSESLKRLPQYQRYGISKTLFWHLYNDAWRYTESCSVGIDGRVFFKGDDTWLNESSEYKNSILCRFVYKADRTKIFVPEKKAEDSDKLPIQKFLENSNVVIAAAKEKE
jgi:hypothetical protein